MIKTDLHVHTAFCDGRDTPAVMARAAWEKGFASLGFSGHSYTPFEPVCGMSPTDTERYCAAVRQLKTQYAGRMDIFLGLEQDLYSPLPAAGYDYIIGSVHYIQKAGQYYPVDLDAQSLDALVNDHFGGDFDSMAEAYFFLVSQIVERTDCHIIGHLDLISKFFEEKHQTPSRRYLAAAKKAIRALLPYERPFEINVGAMTRGYRTAPYPAEELLLEIAANGGNIVLSGDCHDARYLGDCLEVAAALAKKCGFDSRYLLTADGWRKEAL